MCTCAPRYSCAHNSQQVTFQVASLSVQSPLYSRDKLTACNAGADMQQSCMHDVAVARCTEKGLGRHLAQDDAWPNLGMLVVACG